MKKFNLNFKSQGYKKNIHYSLKTVKNYIVGYVNYKLNLFINNKYNMNKHLKLNTNLSHNIYNSALYSYKKIND